MVIDNLLYRRSPQLMRRHGIALEMGPNITDAVLVERATADLVPSRTGRFRSTWRQQALLSLRSGGGRQACWHTIQIGPGGRSRVCSCLAMLT